jgi:RNA polymerase sigma-70 factor (ECF subfamily)
VEEVDEVMQAVGLAVASRPKTLPMPGNVPAFLRQMAVRQTLLYRRKVGRQRKLMDRLAVQTSADPASDRDPLAWLLADERSRLIREALDRLPPRDAEILLLKYAENWSARDLAARLGISSAAVDARLHRVRARLREELAREGLTVPGTGRQGVLP